MQYVKKKEKSRMTPRLIVWATGRSSFSWDEEDHTLNLGYVLDLEVKYLNGKWNIPV